MTGWHCSNDQTLMKECQSIETAKRFALFLFNEAICKYGQDLKHEQQLTEIFADIFTDIYTAESTVVRARKIMGSDLPETTVVDIAKVFTAEMGSRIMVQVHTVVNAIFNGNPIPLVDQKVNEFRTRILLKTNVIGLKRNIANHVFKNNKYPY